MSDGIRIVVSIEAFAKLPTGGEAHLLVSSEPIDGFKGLDAIADTALDLYSDLKFILHGGTQNPQDPWTLDQEEEPKPPTHCQCGQPCIWQNGEYRCLETGDPIDNCRDEVPF